MDPEMFLDLANAVKGLKMYPYLDVAHYAVTCMAVREDLGTGSIMFSRKHPLACWLSSVFACFAGSVLANFLLGEPLIAPFKDIDAVLLSTAVWYLMFYSPFDLTYKVCKLLPFKCALSVMKELVRCKKIHDGVLHAEHAFPGHTSMLIWIIIGTAKGAGSGIIRFVERFLRGNWNASNHEMLQPTFATKASVLGAIIFALEGRFDFLTAPHALVYLGVALFFVYFKLAYLLFGIVDPLLPFENLFCAIFMGGIWDAFSRALSSVGRPTIGGSKGGGGAGPSSVSASTASSSMPLNKAVLPAVDAVALNGAAGGAHKELKSE